MIHCHMIHPCPIILLKWPNGAAGMLGRGSQPPLNLFTVAVTRI